MKKEFNIIGYRRLWYTISGTLFVLSLLALFVWHLNLGIDFTGGSLVELTFSGNRPSLSAVAAAVPSEYGKSSVTPVGDNGVDIRLRALSQDDHQKFLDALSKVFPATTQPGAASGQASSSQPSFHEEQFTSIGPTIGAELQGKAISAIIAVLTAIVLYIAWAFRKVSRPVPSWQYGVAAIVALFHDVFLPIGVFVILGKFLGIQIDTLFITAVLTVLGFSVHDTIVVFDRIRENLAKSGDSFATIVNRSVNETLARSINTSLTTLLVLLTTFIFGGESIHYFVLTLILGIVFGTYSSIFIASPILVSWQSWSSKPRK